jgi:hypothetical protein
MSLCLKTTDCLGKTYNNAVAQHHALVPAHKARAVITDGGCAAAAAAAAAAERGCHPQAAASCWCVQL